MLRTVTNRSPGIGVDTANGFSRVEAIGTALIYLNHGATFILDDLVVIISMGAFRDPIPSTYSF